MQRVHLLISGRVQGVWYRASTRAEADRLGLTGWVRNLSGGQVEAVAEGPRSSLEQLVAWCRRGPPHAVVRSVEPTWSGSEAAFTGFEVRATGTELL